MGVIARYPKKPRATPPLSQKVRACTVSFYRLYRLYINRRDFLFTLSHMSRHASLTPVKAPDASEVAFSVRLVNFPSMVSGGR